MSLGDVSERCEISRAALGNFLQRCDMADPGCSKRIRAIWHRIGRAGRKTVFGKDVLHLPWLRGPGWRAGLRANAHAGLVALPGVCAAGAPSATRHAALWQPLCERG